MIRQKYKIGQTVSFAAEYMYAALYPSGHTEVTVDVDGDGIVTEIKPYSQGFLYTLSTNDLPDGNDEIQLDESELMLSYDDFLDSIDNLFNL